MTPRGYILLALLVIGVVLVLWGLRHSPPVPDSMRTADEKQIERETAAIQRNRSKAPARPAVVETATVRSLCKQRARQQGRHAARVEALTGETAKNPYSTGDAGYVEWAIALAEMHTEIAHAKSPINQFNH